MRPSDTSKDWNSDMNKQGKIQTAKLLAMMFNSFPQSSVADVDAQMEAYVFAVEDHDLDDVSDAIRRIMQGGQGHENRSFVPSTAELCTEIRRRQEIRQLLAAKNLREIGMTGRFVAIEGGKS